MPYPWWSSPWSVTAAAMDRAIAMTTMTQNCVVLKADSTLIEPRRSLVVGALYSSAPACAYEGSHCDDSVVAPDGGLG